MRICHWRRPHHASLEPLVLTHHVASYVSNLINKKIKKFCVKERSFLTPSVNIVREGKV